MSLFASLLTATLLTAAAAPRPATVYSFEEGCAAKSAADLQSDLKTAHGWTGESCELVDITEVEKKPVPKPLTQLRCAGRNLPFVYFHEKKNCEENGASGGRVAQFQFLPGLPDQKVYDFTMKDTGCKIAVSLGEWKRNLQRRIQYDGKDSEKKVCDVKVTNVKDKGKTLQFVANSCFEFPNPAVAFTSQQNCRDVDAYISYKNQ